MIEWNIDDRCIKLNTLPSLFSPAHVDKGTLAMLIHSGIQPGEKVLDLGCGCGPVGIWAAGIVGAEMVTMTDINPDAVKISRENALLNGFAVNDGGSAQSSPGITLLVSDGLTAVADRDFNVILSNPPYHTDFSIAKHFIEDGFKHLKPGGRMLMVTKRRLWYENKLKSVFGGVRIYEEEDYFIFLSEKRMPPAKDGSRPDRSFASKETNHLSKKLQRKYGHK